MRGLEENIRTQMHRAMHELLCDTLSKPTLTAEDVEWVKRLCHELAARINALTPRRADLHAELARHWDVDLLGQELLHGAADAEEVGAIATFVVDRLAMLCAPSQDAAVEALREALREALGATPARAALGRAIGTLLREANRLIDEMEELARPFSAA